MLLSLTFLLNSLLVAATILMHYEVLSFLDLRLQNLAHISSRLRVLVSVGFMDCVYLSFVTYTTVGDGDVFVNGYIRYLTGVEALTGLILVTWSASFLFLEMQRYWSGRRRPH